MSTPSKTTRAAAPDEPRGWTFLTNHSHVLICLKRDPTVRLRDVADTVGITERAVQRIVLDLEQSGVLSRSREGRRNVYEINPHTHLRHPVEGHRTVADLLELAAELPKSKTRRRVRASP